MGRIYTTRTGAGILSAKGIMECFILFSCLIGTEVFAAFLMCDLSHIFLFFFLLAIAVAGRSESAELTY